MSAAVSTIRHVQGFDVVRPLSIGTLIFLMLPLVFLPLASIFIFGTSKGLPRFWSALTAPEAIFALKLSLATSFWATVFNVLFGLFAAYVLSRHNFWGRNALIVTISLPTAIPTACAKPEPGKEPPGTRPDQPEGWGLLTGHHRGPQLGH